MLTIFENVNRNFSIIPKNQISRSPVKMTLRNKNAMQANNDRRNEKVLNVIPNTVWHDLWKQSSTSKLLIEGFF